MKKEHFIINGKDVEFIEIKDKTIVSIGKVTLFFSLPLKKTLTFCEPLPLKITS